MPKRRAAFSQLLEGELVMGHREELPEDWKWATLSEVAEVRYEKARPTDSGDTPVVGSGGAYGSTSEPLVCDPTIVIGRKGTAGRAWLLEQPCWPSDTTFFLLWTGQPVDIRFLHYCFHHWPLSGEHAKTTLPSIQKADLEKYLLPYPPLSEQRAIAHVLRTVQRAKEATEKVIATTRQLKQSLMRHLFTYGPVPFDMADHVELTETDFGSVPAHWKIMPLCDCTEVQTGIAKGRKLPVAESIIVPYLRVANVQDGFLDLTEIKEIQIRKSELGRFALQAGDILLKKGEILTSWAVVSSGTARFLLACIKTTSSPFVPSGRLYPPTIWHILLKANTGNPTF